MVIHHHHRVCLLGRGAAQIGLLLVLLGCCCPAAMAISQEKLVVGVTVDADAPSVTITWDSQATGGRIEILRRPLGAVGVSAFALVASVDHPAVSYSDTTVAVGTAYEYRIRRPAFTNGSTSYQETAAYVAVTVDAGLEDDRGTVLLVVDSRSAALLADELALLELDLVGDGWAVERLTVEPQWVGSHITVKAAIVAACTANPDINALYLFGRVPMARSGMLAPDGHAPSRAHETDLYYADLDGSWTDTANFTGDPGDEKENIAGDGKFDQTNMPSAIELMTGRVDFSRMTAHRKNELEYLRDYIQKAHAWRHGERSVPYQAFNGSTGYLFMEHNWLRPMFGAGYDASIDSFQPATSSDAYVWGVDFYHYAGGNQDYYGAVSNQAIFTINFGSYKQHWFRGDNAMRALLCQPDWGLSSCWGGRPAWHFQHMAAGKPLGYAALRTINNAFNGREYAPQGDYTFMDRYVSLNLLGDPTLRQHPVLPPSRVSATAVGGAVDLAWVAPADPSRLGFHVYRSSDRLGPYTRLTATRLGSAVRSFSDDARPAGDVYYQVRSVAMTTVPTGSYANQSQGVFAVVRADGSSNSAPVAAVPDVVTVGSNLPSRIVLPGSDGDGDTMIPVVVTNPAHGQLRWNGQVPYYVSATDYVGSDRFTYRLFDGLAWSDATTIELNVTAAADDMLIAWRFGAPDSGNQETTSTAQHALMQPSAIDVGSGLSLTTNTGLNKHALYVSRADSSAQDDNDSLGWTVAPQAGHAQSLSRVTFFHFASSSGTNTAVPLDDYELLLQYSRDGFATATTIPLEQGGAAIGITCKQNGGRIYSADLSEIAALQACTEPVAFRLLFWNTSAAGLGKSGDNTAQSAFDLVVFGQVAAPPTRRQITIRLRDGADQPLPALITIEPNAATQTHDDVAETWTFEGLGIDTDHRLDLAPVSGGG